MAYSKQHIANIAIENESSSPRTLPISIHIDTLGAATIAFGDSMSIRTNEYGLDDLRQALFDASRALMVQRCRQADEEREQQRQENYKRAKTLELLQNRNTDSVKETGTVLTETAEQEKEDISKVGLRTWGGNGEAREWGER